MLILVGLGNPGSKYARNRHNIGFMAVDSIAERHGFSPWRSRFQGQVSEGRLGNEKCLLLKPQTYMNESGRSLREAATFYRVPTDNIIVFHDELDLPPGKMRLKKAGGHGGHNGLRSIIAHLDAAFHRVRLGIGHPGDKARVHGHVLSDFHKADQDWLEPQMDALARHAALLGAHDFSTYSNKVHLDTAPEKPKNRAKAKASQTDAAKPGTSKSGSGDAPKTAMADALAKLLNTKKD